MRKNPINRAFLATKEGVRWWEAECRFRHPTDAAEALSASMRSYFRWKADGLPETFQRELILDRMEAALPKRRG